jgi:hypothetical protein
MRTDCNPSADWSSGPRRISADEAECDHDFRSADLVSGREFFLRGMDIILDDETVSPQLLHGVASDPAFCPVDRSLARKGRDRSMAAQISPVRALVVFTSVFLFFFG